MVSGPHFAIKCDSEFFAYENHTVEGLNPEAVYARLRGARGIQA
jgi:hypothetical protein